MDAPVHPAVLGVQHCRLVTTTDALIEESLFLNYLAHRTAYFQRVVLLAKFKNISDTYNSLNSRTPRW